MQIKTASRHPRVVGSSWGGGRTTAACSLPGAGMWQQGSELALQTKPASQHITKVPSSLCSWGCYRLSPFLSRWAPGKLC